MYQQEYAYLGNDMPVEVHCGRRSSIGLDLFGDLVGLKMRLLGKQLFFGYRGSARPARAVR